MMLRKRIHFLGIGGVSMSGLAEILQSKGYIVSGSDMAESSFTEHLKNIGIQVFKGHTKENITPDIELVVYTAAVREDNEELQRAKELSIEVMDRASLLGLIMKNYKCPISVAGTHGKTTSTSILSSIFLQASADPTISIGGVLKSINGNFRMGSSDYFIVETCEYCDSFLKFFPHIAIILNIELDHVDYFKNFDQLVESFKKFSNNISRDGYLVIHEQALDIIGRNEINCNVISYGSHSSDCYAKNISYDDLGYPTYDLYFKNELQGRVTLPIFGDHNIMNSLGAFCVAHVAGLSTIDIINGLEHVLPPKRRFEIKGTFNEGTIIVDDYAHHPTELKTTLNAARKYTNGNIWCVFQPHTYTRTKGFLDEFAESFDECDHIIITDIYAAREKNTEDISSQDLIAKIKIRGKSVFYFDSFQEIEAFLVSKCEKNDLVLTAGAGDVYLIGDQLSTLSTELLT